MSYSRAMPYEMGRRREIESHVAGRRADFGQRRLLSDDFGRGLEAFSQLDRDYPQTSSRMSLPSSSGGIRPRERREPHSFATGSAAPNADAAAFEPYSGTRSSHSRDYPPHRREFSDYSREEGPRYEEKAADWSARAWQDEKGQLLSEIDALSAALESTKRQLQDAKDAAGRNASRTADVEGSAAEFERRASEVAALRSELDVLQRARSAEAGQTASLVATAQAGWEQERQARLQCEKELSQLRQREDESATALLQLNAKLDAANTSVEQERRMIANALAEKARVEAQLDDVTKELAAVKTACSTAEQRAGASSGLSMQLSDAWVRLREVQEELDAAKREKVAAEVSAHKSAAKAHFESLAAQSKVKEAMDAASEAEAAVGALNADLHRLRSENAELKAVAERAARKLTELDASVHQKDELLRETNRANDGLKAHILTLERQVTEAKTAGDVEISALKQQCAGTEAALASLRKDMMTESSSASQAAAALKRTISDLESQLKTATSSHAAVVSELDAKHRTAVVERDEWKARCHEAEAKQHEAEMAVKKVTRELVSERQGRLEDNEKHGVELAELRKSRDQLSRRLTYDSPVSSPRADDHKHSIIAAVDPLVSSVDRCLPLSAVGRCEWDATLRSVSTQLLQVVHDTGQAAQRLVYEWSSLQGQLLNRLSSPARDSNIRGLTSPRLMSLVTESGAVVEFQSQVDAGLAVSAALDTVTRQMASLRSTGSQGVATKTEMLEAASVGNDARPRSRSRGRLSISGAMDTLMASKPGVVRDLMPNFDGGPSHAGLLAVINELERQRDLASARADAAMQEARTVASQVGELCMKLTAAENEVAELREVLSSTHDSPLSPTAGGAATIGQLLSQFVRDGVGAPQPVATTVASKVALEQVERLHAQNLSLSQQVERLTAQVDWYQRDSKGPVEGSPDHRIVGLEARLRAAEATKTVLEAELQSTKAALDRAHRENEAWKAKEEAYVEQITKLAADGKRSSVVAVAALKHPSISVAEQAGVDARDDRDISEVSNPPADPKPEVEADATPVPVISVSPPRPPRAGTIPRPPSSAMGGIVPSSARPAPPRPGGDRQEVGPTGAATPPKPPIGRPLPPRGPTPATQVTLVATQSPPRPQPPRAPSQPTPSPPPSTELVAAVSFPRPAVARPPPPRSVSPRPQPPAPQAQSDSEPPPSIVRSATPPRGPPPTARPPPPRSPSPTPPQSLPDTSATVIVPTPSPRPPVARPPPPRSVSPRPQPPASPPPPQPLSSNEPVIVRSATPPRGPPPPRPVSSASPILVTDASPQPQPRPRPPAGPPSRSPSPAATPPPPSVEPVSQNHGMPAPSLESRGSTPGSLPPPPPPLPPPFPVVLPQQTSPLPPPPPPLPLHQRVAGIQPILTSSPSSADVLASPLPQPGPASHVPPHLRSRIPPPPQTQVAASSPGASDILRRTVRAMSVVGAPRSSLSPPKEPPHRRMSTITGRP